MDAGDLRIFDAVARHGAMNRAAVELNTVQSNVTARVRALEEEIGQPLFHRTTKGVSLTQAGHRLVPYASRIASLLAEAKQATQDDGVPRGALLIGALETTTALRLSPFLAEYMTAHPQVDLTLRTGTSCELIEQVLDRKLDGAFVCGPVNHVELQEEPMFREQLVLLSAPQIGSIEAALGSTDVRIVVLRLGCSYRLMLEGMLAGRGVVNVRTLEFGTLEAIISCVGAGLGVTLLPKALIGPVWAAGRVAVHELPPSEGLVETVFVRRRDAYVSSALSAFIARARPTLKLQAAE